MPSQKQIRRGIATITAGANGNATIAHGLHRTPVFAMAQIQGDTVNGVNVESIDGTNLTIRVFNAAGADVTSGSFSVAWIATA